MDSFIKWCVENGYKTELRNDERSWDTFFSYDTEQKWLVWKAASAARDAEIYELRKDAVRLNYLIEHSDVVLTNDGPYGPYNVWFRYTNQMLCGYKTKRDAIDAAIAQKGEK